MADGKYTINRAEMCGIFQDQENGVLSEPVAQVAADQFLHPEHVGAHGMAQFLAQFFRAE